MNVLAFLSYFCAWYSCMTLSAKLISTVDMASSFTSSVMSYVSSSASALDASSGTASAPVPLATARSPASTSAPDLSNSGGNLLCLLYEGSLPWSSSDDRLLMKISDALPAKPLVILPCPAYFRLCLRVLVSSTGALMLFVMVWEMHGSACILAFLPMLALGDLHIWMAVLVIYKKFN